MSRGDTGTKAIAPVARAVQHHEMDAIESESTRTEAAPRAASLLDPSYGPWPYVNLIYLFFVFLPLFFDPDPHPRAWVATFVAVAVFLPVYFLGWRSGRWQIPALLATAALAYGLMPFNPGGNSLLIYAIAFAGYMLGTRNAIVTSVVLVALLTLQVAWLGYPLAFAAVTAVIGGMVLSGILMSRNEARHNAELRLSQEEVKRLARAHERERIARDLHDLLGHTLSVIAVKAELARRLVERNAVGAAAEIAEVERIAREALTQVRGAVADMRNDGFVATCDNVCAVLEGTGVSVERTTEPLALGPEAGQALAWVLRESVTNILRHAGAQHVGLSLRADGDAARLEITDDGTGGLIVEGHGIRGMRERVQGLGGSLEVERDTRGGTRVRASVPRGDDGTSAGSLGETQASAHPFPLPTFFRSS